MEEKSRTKNSIFNAGSNFIVYFLKTLLNFIVRTIFIKTLGELYLGVNGLLSNVLSMLSLADLGVSSAISFCLYKPLADNDYNKVSQTMTFFKKVYEIIGIIVAIFGTILYFFLDDIIKEYDSIPQLNIIYVLYLINTVSTYYTSYKEVLIIADQKAYKLTKINILFTILLYFLQAIVLLIFKNFIVYLIVQFFIQILQKVATNIFVSRQYDKIDFNCKTKIEKSTLNIIKKNVKAMMLHKIGDYCINGTDNIIISNMINVSTVGYYSNYNMIITMINSIITMIYNNLTASFGNLLVKEDKMKSLDIFKKIDFFAFILYSFCGIMFACLASRFIEIWVGNKYVLDSITVMLISFNFFFTGTRVACTTVRNAAGLYSEDKWVPIWQSIINIVFSISLAKFIGLNGVIIGTIISSILPNIYRMYILYKNIFKEKYSQYLKTYYIPYILYFIITMVIIYLINSFINVNGILGFILVLVISLVLYSISLIAIFHGYSEMTFFIDIIKKVKRKLLRGGNR